MCLLPVCLNWPGFPAFACKCSRLSAPLGSLPSEKYKSKAGCCCRRKPCHQRALGFRSEMVSLGRGGRRTGWGVFFNEEHPSRVRWARCHLHTSLAWRTVTPGTLGAKPPRGDREERGGGPAAAAEGGYAGKASCAPRQSRAAAASARLLK